ncbi:MAG TPA: c-type cytochrome [Puia sp.]|nr:c-type cytochrome [Puia sp.]
MKKGLAIILSCSLLAAACGGSDSSKPTEKKDSGNASDATTPAATTTADNKGLELIGGSDCTTCHRLDKASSGAAIGPAYSEVAAKYAPAADTTIDRLVNKIISGGSGVWGSVPMTPHAAVTKEDAREMVKYIMTLKK